MQCEFCNKEILGRKKRFCNKSCSAQRQTANDIYPFDDAQFGAYLLGLIYADGNLYKQKGKNFIADISLIDKELILYLKNKITPTHKLYSYQPKKGNRSYSFKTRDKKIIEFLLNVGISPRKSFDLNLDWPSVYINKTNEHSFIRGFFDGDGSVFTNDVNRYRYLHVSFTGIKNIFFDKLLIKLNQLGFEAHLVAPCKGRKNTYQIRIYKANKVKAFAEFIYNSRGICLKRKIQKFIDNNYLTLPKNINQDWMK